MRKEWISYMNFKTKRTEQKMEKYTNDKKEMYMMRNSTHIHFYNFYHKLYTNWLRQKRTTKYLW